MNQDKNHPAGAGAGEPSLPHQHEDSPSHETPNGQGQTNEENVVEPGNALPEITIADLPESWLQSIGRAGWTKLMPVQSKAIPYIMAGRNLMVQSRTGTGKTGAFILPILERINPRLDACQTLILVPTRELAQQVTSDAMTLAGDRGIRIVAVYGGVRYGAQLKAFREGAHLVIGTPGRILDHLLKGSLSLEKLNILLFDEADRLLSMGFYPDMREVQRYLPSHRVEGYMFSATFPPRVMRLAEQFLGESEFLGLSSGAVHVAGTEHIYYPIPGMEKDRGLVRIIEIENPDSALIFCNTKAKVHYVAVVLRRFGYDADELSADLSQNARDKVLNRVRQGKLRFLVSTDVAGRGIDIPELSHVIQYEPPEDPEVYIHRAGRTGRAGSAGEAITLVDVTEQIKLKRIAKQYQIDFEERPLPTREDVAAIVSERMTVLLETQLRTRDGLQTERMQRFVPLAQSLSSSEDELPLITMLLDDYYQQSLHSPPPLPPRSESSRRRPDSGGRKQKRRRGGRRR